MRDKISMLDGWLDDWSKQLDELEQDSSKDEVLSFQLFEKFTGFMMRFMQTPSKVFILTNEVEEDD